MEKGLNFFRNDVDTINVDAITKDLPDTKRFFKLDVCMNVLQNKGFQICLNVAYQPLDMAAVFKNSKIFK